MKPYALASLYAGLVVGSALLLLYAGGGPEFALMVGLIAGGATFCAAIVLSIPFKVARERLSGPAYFLLHLAVGLGIGAYRAAQGPYVFELHQYIFNQDALMVTCASLGAWLFVVLTVSPGGEPRSSGSILRDEKRYPVLLFGLAALVVPILVAPVPEDPSCHNALRGGRTSVQSTLRLMIRIPENQAKRLDSIYGQFAEDYSLSTRRFDSHPDFPYRSLCNDDVKIELTGIFNGDRHVVGFVEHEHASGWEPLAGELLCRLASEWGVDTITYDGGELGEGIEKPEIFLRCDE